ncbi:probable photosystem I assembly factor PSA3, chloroplastic [Coccomyxa sp. Obi]|nr:probable photosystem I assembly factor PSA3, chloroplastic [Coccomyxa sp. Obi]
MALYFDPKLSGWLVNQRPGRCTGCDVASCSPRVAPTRTRKLLTCARAAQQEGGGPMDAIKRVARQIQGALPVVGLLSRLSSPSGGIGNDIMAYPEFARQLLYESNLPEFVEATAEWERAYGKVGQRKLVLLYLYFASTAGGVVSGKLIMASARRVRVTQDIEIEIDRIDNARDQIYEKYKLTEKPKGKLQDKIDIAVDSIVQLTLGLREGEEIPPAAAFMLVPVVAGAFSTNPDIKDLVKKSIESRAARKDAYKV